jgi:hypothetical protein
MKRAQQGSFLWTNMTFLVRTIFKGLRFSKSPFLRTSDNRHLTSTELTISLRRNACRSVAGWPTLTFVVNEPKGRVKGDKSAKDS